MILPYPEFIYLLICKNILITHFIYEFYIYVHEEYWFVIFFSLLVFCKVLVSESSGLTKGIGTTSANITSEKEL